MVDLKLGINTGFALNRFPLPEDWMKVVADLGLRYVQLTADLVNPSLGKGIIDDYVRRINSLKKQYGVDIDSVMTGAFTRVNHLSHPDPKVKDYWMDWFKKFIDLGVSHLDATNMSSHFGIMSYSDVNNPKRKTERLEQTVAAWKELAVYAKDKGMKYLSWEPMSITREYGETIAETKKIQQRLTGSAIPIKLCLDVDHGDVSSSNPDDTNPYAWLKEFGKDSPLIHLKQSLTDKRGHYPFTPEYNSRGKIVPEKVIEALEDSGYKESLLLLEFSFREREPFESRVLNDLKTSVDYWRKYVKD